MPRKNPSVRDATAEAGDTLVPKTQGRGFVERIVSGPVLVDPDRVSEFEGCISQFIAHERFDVFQTRPDSVQSDDYWPQPDSWESGYKPYNVQNGVLQIPVMGVLINRMGYQIGRYATGYTYIERAFARGQEDGNVQAIAFVIDSPGGEAAGNFELVDKLFAGRGDKPMRAFVADAAYSGGFSIATACDEIVVTRSGGTGSVGVVTMHVDMSGYLSRLGLKVTFIKAGKHKVDGNSMEPLSDTALKRIQGRIDKIYGVFVSTVARNRDMSEDDVRETEALTYDAEESITVGFADRIGALDEELAAFELEIADNNGEGPMTTKTSPGATAETVSTEDHVAAVAAAQTTGAKAEQTRFATVMQSENYKGREALAQKMLTTTSLSAAEITGLLEDAPKVEAAPAKTEEPKKEEAAPQAGARNHFKERMDAEGGPEVGAGDAEASADTPQTRSASIMAASRKASGAPAPKRQDA
jgi:signal peptide peptidase SppA